MNKKLRGQIDVTLLEKIDEGPDELKKRDQNNQKTHTVYGYKNLFIHMYI